jgi:hypothetical protein
MPTEAEIDAALDAVIVAARAHRALLRSGDRATERDVARAYVALNNATVIYDDLLSEAYDEVTPWDVELMEAEEEPGAVPDPLAAREVPTSGPTLVCVRQRRDYQVPEIADLLRLGTEMRRQNWAAHDPEHAAAPVTNLGEAVYELVLAGDGSLASLDAYSQLIPGNGVLLVNAIEHGLPSTAEDTSGEDDEPFRLSPADPLLYRLDEETVDGEDDDLDDEADGDIDDELDGDREPITEGAGKPW